MKKQLLIFTLIASSIAQPQTMEKKAPAIKASILESRVNNNIKKSILKQSLQSSKSSLAESLTKSTPEKTVEICVTPSGKTTQMSPNMLLLIDHAMPYFERIMYSDVTKYAGIPSRVNIVCVWIDPNTWNLFINTFRRIIKDKTKDYIQQYDNTPQASIDQEVANEFNSIQPVDRQSYLAEFLAIAHLVDATKLANAAAVLWKNMKYDVFPSEFIYFVPIKKTNPTIDQEEFKQEVDKLVQGTLPAKPAAKSTDVILVSSDNKPFVISPEQAALLPAIGKQVQSRLKQKNPILTFDVDINANTLGFIIDAVTIMLQAPIAIQYPAFFSRHSPSDLPFEARVAVESALEDIYKSQSGQFNKNQVGHFMVAADKLKAEWLANAAAAIWVQKGYALPKGQTQGPLAPLVEKHHATNGADEWSIADLVALNKIPKLTTDKDGLKIVILNKMNIVNLVGLELLPNANEIQALFIGGNRIPTIEAHTFAALPNLQKLYLPFNQTHTIAPQAFAGLPQLKNLVLQGNPLKPEAIKRIRYALKNVEVIFEPKQEKVEK